MEPPIHSVAVSTSGSTIPVMLTKESGGGSVSASSESSTQIDVSQQLPIASQIRRAVGREPMVPCISRMFCSRSRASLKVPV